MSIGAASSALPPLPRATADHASLADKQLLTRFFRRREDAAFAALVERHGPLVYRVCRRVLSDANDADDAFQATFMVLVRKGAALKQPERLANWLYGVAYRTARKVKVKSAIRSRHEHEARQPTIAADVDSLTLQELQSILEEEIGNLPEKYALPLTLCYLEGKTNTQAAAQLGWPEGSISRRLSRARELLRSRLVRRGLAMSAALIAAVFAKPAAACQLPAELLSTTASGGSLVLRGVPLEEVVSNRTAAVVREVLAGLPSLGKIAAAALLATSSVALSIAVIAWQVQADPGPRSPGGLLRGMVGAKYPDEPADGRCHHDLAEEAIAAAPHGSANPIPAQPIAAP